MTTPVHRNTANEYFEAIRVAIPADAVAVHIYCRSSVHWTDNKKRAEEISFAFHRNVDVASRAFQSAAQTNVYDWGVLFFRAPDHVPAVSGWHMWDTFT